MNILKVWARRILREEIKAMRDRVEQETRDCYVAFVCRSILPMMEVERETS